MHHHDSVQKLHQAQQPVKILTLLDIIQVVAGRRKVVLIPTLAAALLSIAYCLSVADIYTAKTMILPTQEDKGLMSAMVGQLGGLANLVGGAVASQSTTDLYVSMLKSEALQDPIIDRFKLMERYKERYRSDTYRLLAKKTAVSAGKKDGIVTLSVDDEDPKRAADMADAYVEELGKLAVRLSVTGAGQNRAFLGERLTAARANLAKTEENLKVFQARNKAVQVTAQAEATIKGVAELRAQLAAQEVQLATYRRQFTESSQEVKNLATSVGNLRVQIAKLEGAGTASSIPSVGSVPAIGQEYVRLMREFKTQETLVDLLTKQYEMASLAEAKDFSPFQVIQKARVPEKKSKPHRAMIVFLAIWATFFASIVAAFVLENIEHMSPHDKERWGEMRRQFVFWKAAGEERST